MKFSYSFLLLFLWSLAFSSKAQSYENPGEHQCLKCHSNQSYSFLNSVSGKEEKRLMNPYLVIDTVALRQGVHSQFDCIDCHSGEYATYPHNANLKLEPMNSCLDCHGGDASYNFEKIDEEFKKSVHFKVYGENFSCSKCHNQHTYKPITRKSDNVLEIVSHSNNMCLSCHADMKKYQMVSGHENPKLVEVHEWLPNQELHFEHVRCIECHTQINDSLMVSHNVLNKENALKKCVECHSANSMLKASLYKYQNLQKRAAEKNGNVVLGSESYVIGSHQVPILKILSVIIFLMTVAGIIVHMFFRSINKKKK